jgi:hypothetical protein
MAGMAGDRPYATPQKLYGNAPRTPEFNTGITGDPGTAEASLDADADRFNNLSPHQFVPTSVLQPIESNPGGNGMSAGDAARRTITGEYMGSVNGMSASSFQPAAMLRMSGLDSQ